MAYMNHNKATWSCHKTKFFYLPEDLHPLFCLSKFAPLPHRHESTLVQGEAKI